MTRCCVASLILLVASLVVPPTVTQGPIPPWPGSIFFADISAAPIDPNSAAILANMKASPVAGAGAAKGLAWGSHTGNLQTDLSLMPIHLPTGGNRTCVRIDGHATSAKPDCDDVTGLKFPLPEKGGIEGTGGYGSCSGDCHLLVYDEDASLIWESYASSVKDDVLTSACVIIWDLKVAYPSNLRGDQCTSTDAAGFPVAPLLATSDEVAAGSIPHAMRFALPNDMLQHGVYAHPATHAGVPIRPPPAPAGGPNPSPFYGMRLRLRPNVTAEVLRRRPDSERGANATAVDVVLTAMKTYGIMMADGSSNGVGGIPFMMASDRFSMTKWASIGIDSHFLFGLAVDDFEVLRPLDPTAGPKHDGRIKLTFDCERSAVDGGKRPVRAALTCQGHGTEGRSRWR